MCGIILLFYCYGSYTNFLLSLVISRVFLPIRHLPTFPARSPLRQATTELRVSSGHRRKRYLLYLLYVCVMTTALVAAAVGTDSSGDASGPYRPAFGERVCWFSRRRALMAFFAAPLIVVMVANVALFVGSASVIRRTTQAAASISCAPTKVRERRPV